MCPKEVSSFITVRPEAPEPMMAIFFLGTGALLTQSAQLQGIAISNRMLSSEDVWALSSVYVGSWVNREW